MNNIEDIATQITGVLQDNLGEMLEESRRDFEMRLLQIEDIGWKRLYGEVDTEEGFSLESLKSVSADLYDMVATSPLITRGVQLRHGYTFGKGFNTSVSSTITQAVIDNKYNYNALLSSNATLQLLIEDAACGNAFHIKVGRGKATKIVAVPLAQITGIITDPDDAQRVRYFQRTWMIDGKEKKVWIPLNRYKNEVGTKLPTKIKSEGNTDVPVAKDTVGFMYTGLRPAGWTFGVPTALAAKAWLVMYTESLQNNALLVKMLSQFAWKIINKTGAGARNTGAVVASEKGIAGTASMTGDQDIQAVPRGNDVNFNNVQPLAAMVATAFGVPVIALLSSPGATGGSYGAATTLDEPTLNIMSALQMSLKDYIEEILNSIVSTDSAVLTFPSMSTDADYRKVQAIANAHSTGAIHQSEYRDLVLEVYPVPNPKKGLPKADGFNAWSDPKATTAQPDGGGSGVSGQGKQGSVKGGVENGETNHDNDADRE